MKPSDTNKEPKPCEFKGDPLFELSLFFPRFDFVRRGIEDYPESEQKPDTVMGVLYMLEDNLREIYLELRSRLGEEGFDGINDFTKPAKKSRR